MKWNIGGFDTNICGVEWNIGEFKSNISRFEWNRVWIWHKHCRINIKHDLFTSYTTFFDTNRVWLWHKHCTIEVKHSFFRSYTTLFDTNIDIFDTNKAFFGSFKGLVQHKQSLNLTQTEFEFMSNRVWLWHKQKKLRISNYELRIGRQIISN